MTTPTDIEWGEYEYVLLSPTTWAPTLTTTQLGDLMSLVGSDIYVMPTHAFPLVAYSPIYGLALDSAVRKLRWYDLIAYDPTHATLPEPTAVWSYDTCHDTAKGDALHTIDVIGSILDVAPDALSRYGKADFLAGQDDEYIFDHLDYVMVPLLGERGYIYDNDADMGCVTIWESGDYYLNDYLCWRAAAEESKEREPRI